MRKKSGNKAVARGLVGAEKAQRLNEADLLRLIFVPGFSTRSKSPEVSGRGVGLDRRPKCNAAPERLGQPSSPTPARAPCSACGCRLR